MEEDPLAALGRQYQDTRKRHGAAKRAVRRAEEKRAAEAAALNALRERMRAEIVEAARTRRLRPAEISRMTGYGPEMVRQILRAAGVEPFESKPSD